MREWAALRVCEAWAWHAAEEAVAWLGHPNHDPNLISARLIVRAILPKVELRCSLMSLSAAKSLARMSVVGVLQA